MVPIRRCRHTLKHGVGLAMESSERGVTRRHALGLFGGAATIALVAACRP